MTHEEKHFSGSQMVRDVVIGMSDGLTVPFALAAGLSGAIDNNSIIVTAGIAEIVSGAIAMGLGGYLAGKTEAEHYQSELAREYDEVNRFPEREKEEVREVFEGFGLSAHSQELIVNELAKDKDKWVSFMMRFELGLEKPEINRARKSALTIGISYVVGGLVPLSPYFFAPTSAQAMIYSCVVTILSLFVFGFYKSKLIGQPALKGALKVTMIGILAAACAYSVARWISH
jgi:VIT1/CCC1 family predicted Fe2+/Mn2+ transporter